MRKFLVVAVVALVTVSGLVVVATPQAADAAVAPSGTYSNWYWPTTTSGYYNMDQRLTIRGHTAGSHYFWAHQFEYLHGDGGYLGLQVGSSPNNSKIALFSIYGANGAKDGTCGQFTEGTATGYTCRIDPYNWVAGRTYRLRIWTVTKDSLGEWWGAWVQDTTTGVDSYVGAIRVPLTWGWLGTWSVSWTAYFGSPPATCDDLAWAQAQFDAPTANAGGVATTVHRHQISTTGDCPDHAKVYDVAGGDVQEMGRAAGSIELRKPTMVRAEGAELEWTRWVGGGFDRYEVHRSTSAGFTPSTTTLLTTVRDPNVTAWQDTTAAPGKTFSYRVVAGSTVSNEQVVNTPAAGQARLTVQPGALDGKATYVAADRTSPVGCYDSRNYGGEAYLRVGTAANGVVHRPLLWFDLRGIPPGATVSAGTLQLSYNGTSAPTTAAGRGIDVYKVTRAWQEGSGVAPGSCNGTGASWKDVKGGVAWTSPGGDVGSSASASVGPKARGADGTDSFNVTSLVQQWVSGAAPNHGVLLRLADESVPADNPYFDYQSDNAADAGRRPLLTVTFTDPAASQAPWVAVTSPAAGATVRGGQVPLSAGSGDDRRVERVEFLVDNAVVGTDVTAPFEMSWNSATVGNGAHTITAKATDDAGNVTTSTGVAATVANSAPPAVSLTAPAAGATVTGALTVAATASDDGGVAYVEFYVDGQRIATDPIAPFEAAWNTLAWTMPAFDGAHTLTAKAYDGDGQVSTSAARSVSTANAVGTPYQASFDLNAAGPADDVVPPMMATAAGTVATDPYGTPTPRTVASAPDDSLAPPAPTGCPAEAYCPTVTVTNTSAQTWNGTSTKLWYRWYTPAGLLVAEGKARSAMPAALGPSGTATLSLVIAPPAPTTGAELGEYRLAIDLYDHAAGKWFGLAGNKPVDNPVVVAKNLDNALGLEKFWTFEGEESGAGSVALTNVANGNMLWRWDPWTSPGRGLATVLSLTYNALEDHSRSPLGDNFSLAVSGLTRFGEPLDIHPNKADQISGRSNKYVVFTDGDGTVHRFTGNADGTWSHPPGVHLFLRPVSTDAGNPKYWALSRPDNVTFYYDVDGFPTYIRDRNGNETRFVLEDTPPGEDPGGPKRRVTAVTDPGGRSYALDYYSKDEAKKAHVRGKVEKVTDHSGRSLVFDYYEDGNLLRIRQIGGVGDDGRLTPDRSFIFTYTTPSGDGPAIPDAAARANPDPKTPSQSSRLFSIRDPRGQETTFDYYGPSEGAQLRWKLQSRRNRTGDTTTFGYDLTSRETTVTAPLSRITRHRYDVDGKAIATVNPNGETTSFGWTPDFKIERITEQNGASTAFTYNANGYLTSRTDQLGNVTRLDYENRQIDTADPGTHWSLIAKVTAPEGVATAATGDFEHRYGYDPNGNLVSQVDPAGFETKYTWNGPGSAAPGTMTTVLDPRGGLTTMSDFDANGFPQKVVDAEGGVTRYGYSADGLLRFTQSPLHETYSGQPDVRAYRDYLDYDPFRRLVRSSEPKTTNADRGQLVWTTSRYDPNNNLVATGNPVYGRDEPGVAPETQTGYDAMDRPVSVLGPDRSLGGEQVTIGYDAAGRMVSQTSPRGSATGAGGDLGMTFGYDPADRLVRVTSVGTSGETTRTTGYCYDDVGNRTATVAAEAGLTGAPACPVSASTTHVVRMEYDVAHRLTKVTDPMGNTTSQTYDHNGQVTSAVDQQGKTSSMRYDQRGLVVERTGPYVPGGRTITSRLEYDANGNLTKQISPRAVDKGTTANYVTTTTYDKLNRPTRIALPTDLGTDAAYEHYGYDADSRLVVKSLPVTDTALGTVGPNARTNLTYFDTGWMASSDDPGNPQVLYDYTAEGWQSSRTPRTTDANTSPPNTDRQLRWTYFADGTLASRVDEGDQATTYEYDRDNHLVKVTSAAGVTSPDERPITTTMTYDGFGEITRTGTTKLLDDPTKRVEHFTTYGYDRNGNLVSRGDEGKTGFENAAVKRNTFIYDDADRLVTQYELGRDTSCTGDRRITMAWLPVNWLSTQTTAKASASCTQEQAPGDASWQVTQTLSKTYFDNGLLRSMQTANGSGAVKESHDLAYEQDGGFVGQKTRDVFRRVGPTSGKPCQSATCTETWTYDARGKLTRHTDGHGGTTTFTLDAAAAQRDQAVRAGNVTREVAPRGTTDRTYLGNRLETTTAGGATAKYWYDTLGRLDCITTSSGTPTDCSPSAQVSPNLVTDYAYDYLDRLESVRTYNNTQLVDEAGYQYDALDRTSVQTETHKRTGTLTRRTDFVYLGASPEVAAETVTTSGSTSGAATADTRDTKSYSYDAYGNRFHLTNTESTKQTDGSWLNGSTTSVTYGYDPHSSISLLLNDEGPNTGSTKAAYGYTAYGDTDDTLTDGDSDKLKPFNPYRYTGHRFDTGSQTLDTGYRRYDPGSSRFLQQDLFNNGLADLGLTLDPLSQNRYALAGGNPTSWIEYDGHMIIANGGGGTSTPSNPSGTTPSGSGLTSLQEHTSRHDSAVFYTAAWLMLYDWFTGKGGRVTVTRAENSVPKASARKTRDTASRRAGFADVIYWTDDKVYVWEVKPKGQEKEGRDALKGYVHQLKKKLRADGDSRQVVEGFTLPPRGGPNLFNPNEIINVQSSSKAKGVEVYTYRSTSNPTPDAAPAPQPAPQPATEPARNPAAPPTTVQSPPTTVPQGVPQYPPTGTNPNVGPSSGATGIGVTAQDATAAGAAIGVVTLLWWLGKGLSPLCGPALPACALAL
jgi:RHS repeat-associated protein